MWGLDALVGLLTTPFSSAVGLMPFTFISAFRLLHIKKKKRKENDKSPSVRPTAIDQVSVTTNVAGSQ